MKNPSPQIRILVYENIYIFYCDAQRVCDRRTESLTWFDDLKKNIFCPLNQGLIVKDDLTDIYLTCVQIHFSNQPSDEHTFQQFFITCCQSNIE